MRQNIALRNTNYIRLTILYEFAKESLKEWKSKLKDVLSRLKSMAKE